MLFGVAAVAWQLEHFAVWGGSSGVSVMLSAWEPERNGQPGGFNKTAVRGVATSGAASVTPGDVVITVYIRAS